MRMALIHFFWKINRKRVTHNTLCAAAYVCKAIPIMLLCRTLKIISTFHLNTQGLCQETT